MKKRFITKKRKRKKRKILFFFVLFLLGIVISFYYLNKSAIKIDDKTFVSLLMEKSNAHQSSKEDSIFKNIVLDFINHYQNPASLLVSNYTNNTTKTKKTAAIKDSKKKEDPPLDPLIYIYNSHQTEQYKPSDFLEFSINPTVMMADYILEDIFLKNNLKSIVEEGNIEDILNKNNWKYASSYKASRSLMEQAKITYPTLEYFIDVHRDSLSRDKTTIELNGKSYAKTIFLIGLENPNYQKNLEFTTKINNKLDEKYPGLSKGIYQKGGEGVNGVYNQDFSPTTILIEIGGEENTTTEVLNSTLAFAECFMEVIKTNEG